MWDGAGKRSMPCCRHGPHCHGELALGQEPAAASLSVWKLPHMLANVLAHMLANVLANVLAHMLANRLAHMLAHRLAHRLTNKATHR